MSITYQRGFGTTVLGGSVLGGSVATPLTTGGYCASYPGRYQAASPVAAVRATSPIKPYSSVVPSSSFAGVRRAPVVGNGYRSAASVSTVPTKSALPVTTVVAGAMPATRVASSVPVARRALPGVTVPSTVLAARQAVPVSSSSVRYATQGSLPISFVRASATTIVPTSNAYNQLLGMGAPRVIQAEAPIILQADTVTPTVGSAAAPATMEAARLAVEPTLIVAAEQPAEVVVQQTPTLEQALEQVIPQGVRVCILGGTKIREPESEALVKELAAELSARLRNQIVVLTGGMSGVQETFAKGCAGGPPVVNMLPKGEQSNFGVGVDFAEFANLDERIQEFGQVGDIYISVEGGPGVSKEAAAAFARGAVVLPMMSTGGASSGKMDFPAGALEQPAFASPEQWEVLKSKGMPQAQAQVVADIITAILPQ